MTDPKLAGRDRAREISAEFLARGDAVHWFDAFYRDAAGDDTRIPWADREGHPMLADWLAQGALGEHGGRGRRALVVGCGLGEDAALLERAGWRVTAFDVSPTAIAWCPRIWPDSQIEFRTVNLFESPAEWTHAFDLVVEIYTLQAMPAEPRPRAIERIASFVAAGGELLVVTRGRAADEAYSGQLPWPLLRSELDSFGDQGLELARLDELDEPDEMSSLRWRALFRRPAGS